MSDREGREAGWYRFNFKKWAADTTHLTLAEEGAYLRLVNHYMQTEKPLLDNDQALARIIGVGLDEATKLLPTLRAFFTERGGFLHLKRADNELRWKEQQAATRRERAKKGGKTKSELQRQGNALAATSRPQALIEQCSNLLEQNRTERTVSDTTTGSDNQDRAVVAASDATKPEPPKGESHDAEAGRRAIIDAFDSAQAEVFAGARRPFAAGDDWVFATRWWELGVGVSIPLPAFRALAVAKMAARKSAGLDAPRALRWMEGAVRDFVAAAKAPPKANGKREPSMAPGVKPEGALNERLAVWEREGFWLDSWGPRPGQPGGPAIRPPAAPAQAAP